MAEWLMGFCQNTSSLQRHVRCISHSNKEKAMASDLIKHTSDATFDADVIKSATPVVVDFWAEWCGPCRMMAPEYEKACAMLEPHARFVKVDTEAHQEVGAKHNIRSIPTLAIFKGGKEVARISGARSAADLAKWVRTEIGK